MAEKPVVIIGAGLSGLCCALHLQQHGIAAVVLEASDAAGGRARTDEVEGFLLDRGFQVFLTHYPEARQVLDYATLDFRSFFNGANVWLGGRFHRLADPFRHPAGAVFSFFSPVGSPIDKMKVGLLRQKLAMLADDQAVLTRPEMTTRAYLEREGFSRQMIDAFFRPFFGGVFFDGALESSSRMFEFVFRNFALGDVAIPARGIQQIPEQLAKRLLPETIRLGCRIESLVDGGVVLHGGERLSASHVVVATDWPGAKALLPQLAVPASCGVTTLYYASTFPATPKPMLVLNGDREGPINNLAVLSQASPHYAPAGQHLTVVSVLGIPSRDEAALEAAVRKQLMDWYGPGVSEWRHLRTYHIAHALPSVAYPQYGLAPQPVSYDTGITLCGDYRETPSFNGAMVSGRKAAEAVMASLKQPLVAV